MPDRLGTRIVKPGLLLSSLCGPGLGEDWVVPKSKVRYLVQLEVPSGFLLNAYDEAGRIVGERFHAATPEEPSPLRLLAGTGVAEPLRVIPEAVKSALAFLDDPES